MGSDEGYVYMMSWRQFPKWKLYKFSKTPFFIMTYEQEFN